MMTTALPRWRRFGATTLLALSAVALSTVVLTGCAAQSTPTNRFTLPEADGAQSSSTAEARTTADIRQLAVSPVEVASYLDQEGIVMQTSDIELAAANQNLWAEELSHQLTRRLRQSLTANLPGMTVLSAAQSGSDAQRLTLSVDQFQGRYDGQAVASGEWQLHDGNRLVAQHHFDVTQPLSDDGYPALVRTLGTVWDQVGQQVADEIRTALTTALITE
ncbi:PqiC family protein [Salinicola halophyticus]|uniref:PqiC family protein n=1 Tax=Salinicola halophyticus TaxID=1808881 RepID=UPI001FD8E148|nr:ABC-type transport auxiliary lipoprotein family protein [Salinicola halophyticus]